MHKTLHCRSTFQSCDVEKVHAVVARSRFRSQNAQNASLSEHFSKLRCGKSARRCGAKHILMSKCAKHTTFGPLLDVQPHHTTLHYSYKKNTPATSTATTTTATTTTATTTTTQHNTTLQLHHTTPHDVQQLCVWGAPKSTTPTTFRSISGFALPSMHHNNSHLLCLSLKLPPPPAVLLV